MVDWEMVNKVAFWMLVQTYLLKKESVTDWQAVRILYVAQQCRGADLPTCLLTAVNDFMDWQLDGKVKPKWYQTPIGGGVA